MNTLLKAGHVAIVTGGSRGLGKALARELLARGVDTIIDSRDLKALDEATEELRQLGNVVAIGGDVSDKNHAHALIAAARELGRLDLLVNNASTLGEVPLPRVDQLKPSTFQDIFNVNVFAPIHLMQHATGSCAKPATKASSSTSPPTPPSRRIQHGAATAHRKPRSSISHASSPLNKKTNRCA